MMCIAPPCSATYQCFATVADYGQIKELEAEVLEWMTASEQLQKLGEDAVAEISSEAERLRKEVQEYHDIAEKERQRRREAEAEVLNSQSKLEDLDKMLRRLLGGAE